jgi:hypothetical protein
MPMRAGIVITWMYSSTDIGMDRSIPNCCRINSQSGKSPHK